MEPAHSCPEVLDFLSRPLDRISDKPLPEADLTLFVDGSSVLRADGRRRAAYAVVTLEANKLPEGTTSQKAELIALTQALTLVRGKKVTVYTVSKYTFLIVHSHSALWKEGGFLSAKGSPVVNASLIAKLLQATDLPSAIAVVHCKGHQASWDPVSHGNAQVDAAARELTAHTPPPPILFLTTDIHPAYSPQEYSTLLRQGGHSENEG